MKTQRTKLTECVMNVTLDATLLAQLDAVVPVVDPARQSRNEVVRIAIRRLIADMARDQRAAVARGDRANEA